MKIKSFIIVFMFLISIGFAFEYEEKIEKSFKLTKDGLFKLSNINGSIKIDTHKKNVALIKAIKSTDRKSDLNNIEVKFEYDKDKLKVSVKKEKKWGRINYRVNFIVKLPEQLKSVNASSINGKVETKGAFKNLNLRTINGKIEFNGNFNEGNFSSVNGKINVYQEDILKGDTSLKTVNGSVNLKLNRKSSFVVEGATLNGSIRSEFGLSIKKGFIGSKIRGTINEGEYKIYLKSVNGSIRLLKI